MSVAYAMMSAGDISIRAQENIINRCLELKTERFGPGYVYNRIYAVTGLSRSFRFDQISETYYDRKMMEFFVNDGRGELVVHPAIDAGDAVTEPILIYVYRDEYMRIIEHNQHHGYKFVIFDNPTSEEYQAHRLTEAEYKQFQNEFNGV